MASLASSPVPRDLTEAHDGAVELATLTSWPLGDVGHRTAATVSQSTILRRQGDYGG